MTRRIGRRVESYDRKRVYASQFEHDVCEGVLDSIPPLQRVDASTVRIPYSIYGDYIPDLVLPNGVVVEIKGWFPAEDRRKIHAVVKSNENLDLRMVFSDPWTKQGNLSAPHKWCHKRGITWAGGAIPREWLDEPQARWQP